MTARKLCALRQSRRMMSSLSGEKPLVTTRRPAALLSESVHQPELDAVGLAHLAMRLSTTLGSISEAFVTLDVAGRFTYLNHESERLLQREGATLLGNEIWPAQCASADGYCWCHPVQTKFHSPTK